jgi:hypothetical protein
MSVVSVLALIAGGLAVLSMIPQLNSYPVLAVSALLLAVALYVAGAI